MPLLIKVRGYQWWWDVDYLDARTRGDFHDRERNSYSGRAATVRFQLEGCRRHPLVLGAQPRGKAGSRPRAAQRTQRSWRETAGVYRGQCAEFCGHAACAYGRACDRRCASRSSMHGWRQQTCRRQRADAIRRGESRSRRLLSKPVRRLPHRSAEPPAVGTTGPDLTHVGRPPIHRGRAVRDHPRLTRRLDCRSANAQARQQHADGPLQPKNCSAVSAYMASLK